MAGTLATVALNVANPEPRVFPVPPGGVFRLITAASSTAKLETSDDDGFTWRDWAFGTVAQSLTRQQMAGARPMLVRATPVTGTATFEIDSAAAGSTSPILMGLGDPTSAVQAPIGTLYLRTDGSTSTTLYVKTGALIANWTAK